MQSRRKQPATLYAAAISIFLASVAACSGAGAEDLPPPGTVGLDRLLRLPSAGRPQTGDSAPRPGGAGAAEWRARFAQARVEIETARQALEAAQSKLGALASDSSQWQMNAPGLGGAASTKTQNSPVSYQLHQEIKRQREEIERAERRLQDLRVEAALAGVPEDWTRPADATGAEPASSARQP